MDRVLQAECFDERREVGGIRVQVVALPGLARAAMAAAVVGDASVAVGGQKEHLVLEGVRAQRPAVAEDDGLPRSPVVVVDLRTVCRGDCAHRWLPSSGRCSELLVVRHMFAKERSHQLRPASRKKMSRPPTCTRL